MAGFNAAFTGLDDLQRAERYRLLAAAALEDYRLESAEPIFVAHNAGVAYRVEAAGGDRFVLKIEEPVGEGEGWGRGRTEAALAWLAALARETELVVQEPVVNRAGGLLTAVSFDDLDRPFDCSLQRWVAGEQVGHFTPDHARRIGAAVARVHRHGATWVPPGGFAAHDTEPWVAERVGDLPGVVDLGIVSPAEWQVVEAAAVRADQVLARLGRGPAVWGAIHGDLHHGNVLFQEGEVRLIDFGGFSRTYLAHDLGSALYHVMYQELAVRRALVEGYGAEWLDEEVAGAAVCAAAIDNLAFQITIPAQRGSTHTVRNVRELADVFCRRLLAREPFVLG